MAKIENLAITSIENIEVYSLNDEYIGTLDELNSATMTQGQEKVDIVGAKGAKLMEMKRGKTVEGKASNGLFNLPIAAADLGSEVKHGQTRTYRYHEVLTVSGDAASLSYTPAGTAGAEIFGLYVLDSNGVADTAYTQTVGTPATGEFKLTGKALSFFADDIADNARIVVYYDRTMTNATVVTNVANMTSKNVHLVLNAIGESPECQVYVVQIDVPKASLSGNFDIGGGDNQVMHDISWSALSSRCGGGTPKFWDYVILADADVAAAE